MLSSHTYCIAISQADLFRHSTLFHRTAYGIVMKIAVFFKAPLITLTQIAECLLFTEEFTIFFLNVVPTEVEKNSNANCFVMLS